MFLKVFLLSSLFCIIIETGCPKEIATWILSLLLLERSSKVFGDIIIFYSGISYIIRFPDYFHIFPYFVKIFRFHQFWPYFLTKLMFTSQIWYDQLLFRNFIHFPDFFRIFSGFSKDFFGFKNFLVEIKVYYAHCKKLPLYATHFCLQMETKYTNWYWLTVYD